MARLYLFISLLLLRFIDSQTVTINTTIGQKEIGKLKGKKATGPDGVPERLLKSAGRYIAPSLKRVIKHSGKACKPPDQWKIARVSAAFKKGTEEDRTCYSRPLSMLSIPTKLMESCVESNIIDHAVTQNLLDDNGSTRRESRRNNYL